MSELSYRREGPVVVADTVAPCGKGFPAVFAIYEPEGDNPGIEITAPGGVVGVRLLRTLVNEVLEQVHLMGDGGEEGAHA